MDLGGIGSIYNLTMDPFEKYDMTFNGAAVCHPRHDHLAGPLRRRMTNGWALSLIEPVIADFDISVVDFPSIKRFPGGASGDMTPDLQNPANPMPLMDIKKVVKTIGMGD